MGAKYFLDERELQRLGWSEPNISLLRAITEFLNVKTTVNGIQDAGFGLIAKTAADTFAARTLTEPADGFTITNPGGIAGDPTFALANDLAAVEGLSGTGIIVRTASETWDERTLQAPAAGFTITNPAGIAGDPTFVLANDLASLEAASGTNDIYYRSAADTWNPVTIGSGLSFAAGTLTATAVSFTDEGAQDAVGTILTDTATIDFTYDDATPSITASVIAGSIGPTQLEATAVTPGSYTSASITVDADGRITAASDGSGGILPMVDGSEPPNLVYDEDGQLIYFEV